LFLKIYRSADSNPLVTDDKIDIAHLADSHPKAIFLQLFKNICIMEIPANQFKKLHL
jgi:hypothetical protein